MCIRLDYLKGFLIGVLVLSLSFGLTGCVHRIVSIDSQPQGAEVYFDRKLIGQTPCSHEFFHYGGHHLEIAKDGYANLRTVVKLKGPVYEYFPLSVFSELLIPWQIKDAQTFNFELKPGEAQKPIISPIEQPQPSLAAPQLERIQVPE